MREARPENLGERFGDPGAPDPGEATSSAASASSMRERAAQELSPEMGRMGAEDPSTALPDEPQLAPAYYATQARSVPGLAQQLRGDKSQPEQHDSP